MPTAPIDRSPTRALLAELEGLLADFTPGTATRKRALLDALRGQLDWQTLDDGSAWDKFVEWITVQGGDRGMLEDPDLLPRASLIEGLPAPCDGIVAEIDAREVRQTVILLGGGRQQKGDPIDYSVGVVFDKKVGDPVEKGDRLLTIHANDEDRLAQARRRLLAAVRLSDETVMPPPHTHKIIR